MKLLLLFTGLLFSSVCGAQIIQGLPEIINYSKQEYGAGSQNWEITQDSSTGLMYFANNEGLLCFDGSYWRTYPLPNKTIVRSLALAARGRIYVGGQGEIGYFSPDKQGRLKYRSLVHLIPEAERSFADVWNIVLYKGAVFFQSSRHIFQYTGSSVIPYTATEWLFMGLANQHLLAQDAEKGLLEFRSGFWEPILPGASLPKGAIISSLTTLNTDSSLLTTLKHGAYILTRGQLRPWNPPDLKKIAANQVYASCSMDEQKLVLTTNTAGCFVMDRQGRMLSSFSRKEGLQNNNVLSALTDKNKNLWLGLDNGIAFISYNNAVRHIYPDAEKDASGYASAFYRGQLYLGTSNGLFRAPLQQLFLSPQQNPFKLVPNTEGQVWNLSEVNDRLLLGHHEGAFLISEDGARPLDRSAGFWTFLPLFNVLPSTLMIAGNYNGIGFYKYSNRGFEPVTYANFESARFVTIDGRNVWVSHPYKGVFRIININGQPQIFRYEKSKGIASVNNNYVFKIRNQVIVSTDDGIMEYNAAKDAFLPSAFYNRLFGNLGIRYMKEDQEGNIWFVFRKNLGVADFSESRPRLIFIPELNNKMVSGFEHVQPFDRHNVLVGADKGFYHIDFDHYKQLSQSLTALIRSVTIFNKKDSLLFGGYAAADQQQAPPEVSFSWNNFHFDYSSTLFGQKQNIEYSYFLKGFDKSWSEWTQKTSKEYTNLPAGKYTFYIKARNNLGNTSEAASYSFSIAPPWYQTPVAYALYGLMLLIAFYSVYHHQKRKLKLQHARHRQEQERLKYLHQLEMDKSEKQIVQLKNEKLEAEISYKNKELASVAMHLVQKGELLRKIREELVKMKNQPEKDKSAESVKKLIKIIQEEEKMDDDWEYFAAHFDKVHSDFVIALKEHYPNLTANELKLCAYLRLNLSTKEVAQLMNISVRGVEISRYRLRKKLGIPTEVNLFDFLMNINTANAKV